MSCSPSTIEVFLSAEKRDDLQFIGLLQSESFKEVRNYFFQEEFLIQTAGKGVSVAFNMIAQRYAEFVFRMVKAFPNCYQTKILFRFKEAIENLDNRFCTTTTNIEYCSAFIQAIDGLMFKNDFDKVDEYIILRKGANDIVHHFYNRKELTVWFARNEHAHLEGVVIMTQSEYNLWVKALQMHVK
jgi:hypothetical protein